MQQFISWLLGILGLVNVVSAVPTPMPTSIPSQTPEQKCIAEGGTWRSEGLLGQFRCNHLYPDGGRPCTKSSECMGGCIVVYEGKNKMTYCKKDDSPFGCFGRVEDGGAILCRD